jgi:putative effector of murein hydrolase LrgA (UPF0299 family)
MKPASLVLGLVLCWLAREHWAWLRSGLPGFILGCGVLFLCFKLLKSSSPSVPGETRAGDDSERR